MCGIDRYAQNLHLKGTLEKLLGDAAWTELKETNSPTTWRIWLTKAINGHQIAVQSSVQVYETNWLEALDKQAKKSVLLLKKANTIESLIDIFSSAMVERSFLLIGQMPYRTKNLPTRSARLVEKNWNLSSYSSTIVVRSKDQLKRVNKDFFQILIRECGLEKARDLKEEFELASPPYTFREWCAEFKLITLAFEPKG